MKQSALVALFLCSGLLAHSFLPAGAQYSPAPAAPVSQPAPAMQTKMIDIGQRLLTTNGIKEPITFVIGGSPTAFQTPGPGNYMPGYGQAPIAMPPGMELPPGVSLPSSAEMAQALAMMSSMGLTMPGMGMGGMMGMPGATMSGSNQVVLAPELLNLISNDDELAAALAHEIAHIVEDPVKQMQRSAKRKATTNAIVNGAFGAMSTAASIAGGFAGPAGMLGSQAIGAARGLAQRGSGGMPQIKPPDEKELDSLTLDYMVKAGYQPTGLEALYQEALSTSTALPPFFMTHQVGSARVATVHAEILKKYPKLQTASSQPVADTATTSVTGAVQPTHSTSADQAVVSASVTPIAGTANTLAVTTAPGTGTTQNLAATTTSAQTFEIANNLSNLLPPEESRVLNLINEKGYLARTELDKQFNALEAKALPGVLDALIQKKLIRTVGTQPNDGFVLTDNASQTFAKTSKP